MTTVAVPPTASSWPGLEKFNLVQDYLEKNKLLITEINNNHEIRSSEGLARNVYLIRELNNNVAKVQTAGQMGALAAGHHELIVEVVPFGNGLLMCTAPFAPGACTESSLGSGLSTH